MKKILIVVTVLFAQLVVAASALAVIVDFPSVGTTSVDITTAVNPGGLTLNGVTFRYDDLGSGVDFATVDQTGVLGTTPGNLILDFSTLSTGLNMGFSLLGLAADTFPALIMQSFSGLTLLDTVQVAALFDPILGTASGSLAYNGPAFDRTVMFFSTDALFFSVDSLAYTPVPEPGTIALLAAGLLGLGGWRRYGRKNQATA